MLNFKSPIANEVYRFLGRNETWISLGVIGGSGAAAGLFVWNLSHIPFLTALIETNTLNRPERIALIKSMLSFAFGFLTFWLFASALLSWLTQSSIDRVSARVTALFSLALPLPLFAYLPLVAPMTLGFLVLNMALTALFCMSFMMIQAAFDLHSHFSALLLPRRAVIAISIVSLLYTLHFSFLTTARHNAMASTSDLGLFTQVLHSITTTGKQLTSLAGTQSVVNFMAFRFSPIFYLLSPIYFVAPSAKTLLILQSACVGIGIFGFYLFALGRAKSTAVALLLALSFALHPALHRALQFDFHDVMLVVPFLFLTFYFMDAQRWGLYWLFLPLATMCREEIAITTVLIGAHIILEKKSLKHGLLTMLFGITYFISATVIMQFLGAAPDWNRFSGMIAPGMGGMKGVLATILTNPWWTLKNILFHSEKMFYFAQLLVPVLFLPLLDVRGGIVAMAAFAVPLLATVATQYMFGTHYATLPVVMIYFMTARAIGKVRPRFRLAVAAAIVFSSVLMNHQWGLIGQYQFTRPAQYSQLESYFDQIPPEASVSTMTNLVPHLAGRREIYQLPYNMSSDYILVERSVNMYYNAITDQRNALLATEEFLHSKAYGIVKADENILLLKKGHDTAGNAAALRLLAHKKHEAETLPSFVSYEYVNVIDYDAGGAHWARKSRLGDEDILVSGPFVSCGKGERYKVIYRLKVRDNKSDEVAATMQITCGYGAIQLAIKSIKQSEFKEAGKYQDFTLEFTAPSDLKGVESRLFCVPKVEIWNDYIEFIPMADGDN